MTIESPFEQFRLTFAKSSAQEITALAMIEAKATALRVWEMASNPLHKEVSKHLSKESLRLDSPSAWIRTKDSNETTGGGGQPKAP